jgi:hypothetical protein
MRHSLILGEDEVFLSATKRGLFVSPTGCVRPGYRLAGACSNSFRTESKHVFVQQEKFFDARSACRPGNDSKCED